MNELEKKVLEAIEGHSKIEICEALLLMLHRTLGTTGYHSFLKTHEIYLLQPLGLNGTQ